MFNKDFINDESGAVTVDWVVLTAALVGLGLAVMAVISTGLQSQSTAVQTQMSDGTIIKTAFSGLNSDIAGLGGLSAGDVSNFGKTALNDAYGVIDQGAVADGATEIAAIDNTFVEGVGYTVGGVEYTTKADAYEAAAATSTNIQAYSDNATLLDEANQRGLSWNEATSEFE
ncbi:hypothetical protein [Jannaschia formosa]|uniref:hypothetical protein n=1 Tax=Jannaschia formosa TaxID=2259592 RepID=UPI000E1B5BC5|nr:hypothetical protein [Jannaschia formosa]TFL19007.1 hypothetical protein DR046_06230 [Jannaschia formosa]